MQVYKLNFSLLLLAGVITSFLLVPSKQERALMFLQDRQFKQAESIYEESQQVSYPDRNHLIPLTKIYQGKGEPDAAIGMYENYLKKYPEDIEVWEKLSELYSEAQRVYDDIEVLEQILKKQPSIKRYVQLIRLYDAAGIKGERLIAALSKVVQLDPERERDTLDLILLQAGSGHLVEANRIMDEYVARFSERMEDGAAELRLRLLLSTGREQDAFAWAEQWLKNHQNVSFQYMALLYSGGLTSNFDAAVDAVAAVDPRKMPAWLVSAVMKAGWDGSKMKFLESFVSRLGTDVVSEYPVIMARLALKRGDARSLKKWITAAEIKPDLTVYQQLHLMMLYFMTERMATGLASLSKLAERPEIPASELTQVVPFILNSDYIEDGLRVFNSLREHREDKSINYAWALLATAAGKTQAVTKWLNDDVGRKLTRRFLTDLYYSAADQSNFELAATVGRRLYSQYKSSDEAHLLISALLGINKDSSEVNEELIELLQEQMHVDGLSRKERRAMAFQLLRVGGKQEAINEFQLLAEAEGPDGENVQQLLFIWGPMPGEKALDWLEARARNAPVTQLAGWWQHLMQAGGAERVTAKMEFYIDGGIPAEAEDVLVHALRALRIGGFTALDQQLRAQAGKTTASVRLEQLATIAGSARLTETEQVIWQRLYDLESTNTKAMKALGIAAFNRGDIPKAKNYLTQFLRLTKGDWESTFYLGEIFSADARQSQAQLYFKKSLEFIETEPDSQKRKQIARAYLLYRLGKIQAATNAYDKLIESYPDDLDLRADYSSMLIDEGRLEMASHLLRRQR